MQFYSGNSRLPEALALIALAIAESKNGLTISQMKNIYESVVGRHPSDRTIQRLISRINCAIDPLEPAIIGERQGKCKRYKYFPCGEHYFKAKAV